MLDFQYQNATQIVFGEKSQKAVGKMMRGLGNKVLLHYGGGSIKVSGLYQEIVALLEKEGLEVIPFGGVVPNPRLSLVEEGIDLCNKEGIDCILAVGGGSVIDSAKAIGIGVKSSYPVWDFFTYKKTPREMLPLGVVLTIPAAGSETSMFSVITKEDGWIKRGVGASCMRPVFACMNPRHTMTLPNYQTACGASDMLAHVMERYFSHTKDITLGDSLCEATMKSIIDLSLKVIHHPQEYGPRAELMWAGTMAHNGILDLGRATDWASHGIEHELSAIYDIAHGAGLSIIFPAWMRYVAQYPANHAKLFDFATKVLGIEPNLDDLPQTIERGVKALETFYQAIDLPIRLREVDVLERDIPLMAQKATQEDTITLGGFQILRAKDVESIYRLAW